MMRHTRELREAQDQFGEVVEQAVANGPQIVTRDGVEVAVVLSFAEYQRLLRRQLPLGEYFRLSPLQELGELDERA